MTEDDYFSPMPSDDELMSIFGLTRQEAGRLWCEIKERRFQIFEKVKRRRKQNEDREQRQRQPEPQKEKEDDWLFELLILLIILRQKQRLELNHTLIMSLINITKQIDNHESNEMQPVKTDNGSAAIGPKICCRRLCAEMVLAVPVFAADTSDWASSD